MGTRKIKRKNRSGKNRTPISGHTRQGKELLPPFAKLNMSPASWMDERLPEMLWAALIRVSLPRDHALAQFRRFLDFIFKHPQKEGLSDITLTGFSLLDKPLREELISFLIAPAETAQALASLRLFNGLPARETWDALLPQIEPDIQLLMSAVGAHLWHQSQEATDCRWVRVMAKFLAGQLHVPQHMAQEWCGYPNEGDQRAVRPGIRATEISFGCPSSKWPADFWQEAWQNTPCMELVQKNKEMLSIDPVVTRSRVTEVLDLLRQHWSETHSTTAIDAKHDAVFGMAFYAMRLLEELLSIGVGTSILGRLGLRTILEVHISLRFLLMKNDEALWKRWRTFGAGQAKLNALRFDDTLEAPKYLSIENIEQIAGEDIWEEMLPINIGSWSGFDLRRLGQEAGLKDTYDKYYSWTSGYVHGTWGPIRESCFRTCGNPLHRLHRYPESQSLPDAVDDAALLLDNILDDLGEAYPDFHHRVSETRRPPRLEPNRIVKNAS